jgi:aminobutyraldehyde dehydrogenase
MPSSRKALPDFMLVSEMPHGGLKASGYGKDLSMYGLEDYTVARHVMVKL